MLGTAGVEGTVLALHPISGDRHTGPQDTQDETLPVG